MTWNIYDKRSTTPFATGFIREAYAENALAKHLANHPEDADYLYIEAA